MTHSRSVNLQKGLMTFRAGDIDSLERVVFPAVASARTQGSEGEEAYCPGSLTLRAFICLGISDVIVGAQYWVAGLTVVRNRSHGCIDEAHRHDITVVHFAEVDDLHLTLADNTSYKAGRLKVHASTP